MSVVAIVSTYTPSEEFGGPARIFHARAALERHGHRVIHVVVDAGGARGALRGSDLRISLPVDHAAGFDPIYHDVVLGERAAASTDVLDAVRGHLSRERVDLVVLEQPFLLHVVQRAAEARVTPIVYSSQNVEYLLRKELERFAPERHRAPERYLDVKALEQRAVDSSVAVTVICPADAERLGTEFGCRRTTLVPNGSSVATSPLPSRVTVSGVYFAFAGSAYWPNGEGLADVATPSLAFLPPDVRVQVAGSVCSTLRTHPRLTRHDAVNFSRLLLNGFLPMDELVDLMFNSTAVLVPIFLGQGSNLKAADALASGAPAIMSSRAVNGYEDVLAADDEGVTVVDTPNEFRHAMMDAMDQPRPQGAVGAKRRAMLSWAGRLEPFGRLVDELVGATR